MSPYTITRPQCISYLDLVLVENSGINTRMVNSLWPVDIIDHGHQWLVQVIIHCLFIAKPLPLPMLVGQFNPQRTNFKVKFESEYKIILTGVYTKFSDRLSEEPFPWLIQKFPCILIFKTEQPGSQLNLSKGQIRLDLTSGQPLV